MACDRCRKMGWDCVISAGHESCDNCRRVKQGCRRGGEPGPSKPRKRVRVGEAGPPRVREETQEVATPRRTHATKEGGANGGEEGPLVDVLRDIASTLKQLAAMTGNIAWLADKEAKEWAEERKRRREQEEGVTPRREQGVGTTDGEVVDGMDEERAEVDETDGTEVGRTE